MSSPAFSHLTRFQPGRMFDLEFNITPFSYTRLNQNSRWSAGKGSQEYEYIRWKERVRDLYDQLGYQVYDWGVPLSEPLSISGHFEVEDNFEGRDLDNIMKGIVDCLNPSRRKDWKDLKTFQWIDDRSIFHHSGFYKIPAKEPRILLHVRPLWGREDPNLNFVDGELGFNGSFWTITVFGYPFFISILTDSETLKNLIRSADPFKVGLDEEITKRLWIWPHSSKGQYVTFLTAEALILYQFFHTTKGLSTTTAQTLFTNTPWHMIWEGLLSGNAQKWVSSALSLSKASMALSKIREQLGGKSLLEHRIIQGQNFDPTVFETTAKNWSEEFGSPWGSVRDRLRHSDINWSAPTLDVNYNSILSQLQIEKEARDSAKKLAIDAKKAKK
jgi:Holliday junction resolvase RusA-like endonuclease